MRAWIISIGDEILAGKVIDWNAYWIAKRLTSIGIQVRRIVSIPDDPEILAEVIREATSNAELIITTGGLGPTPGDITVEGLCKATGREIVLDPKALEFVKRRYQELHSLGLVDSPNINKAREKMAWIPKGAEIEYNDVGVAPAIILNTGLATIIALPGPPPECMYLFEKIVPRIRPPKELFTIEKLIEISDESEVAELLLKVRQIYPDVHIKTYPIGFGQNKMQIIVMADTKEKASGALEMLTKLLKTQLN
ncbi:MAG: molybdopterin-binding protein [Candidatus Korarchaeota archaeon]|nr:molybdopterin-binding protein [Thermoproteota archaeon]